MNDAEDRSAGADTKGQREHSDRAEAGLLAQLARRIVKILQHALEPQVAPLFAAFLPRQDGIAELQQSPPPRLFRRHALGQVFTDLPFQVSGDFVLQIFFELAAFPYELDAAQDPANGVHSDPKRPPSRGRWRRSAGRSSRSASPAACARRRSSGNSAPAGCFPSASTPPSPSP